MPGVHPYASVTWIRFEGSSCRTASVPMTSQPPGGAPLGSAKKARLSRRQRQTGFVADPGPLKVAGGPSRETPQVARETPRGLAARVSSAAMVERVAQRRPALVPAPAVLVGSAQAFRQVLRQDLLGIAQGHGVAGNMAQLADAARPEMGFEPRGGSGPEPCLAAPPPDFLVEQLRDLACLVGPLAQGRQPQRGTGVPMVQIFAEALISDEPLEQSSWCVGAMTTTLVSTPNSFCRTQC